MNAVLGGSTEVVDSKVLQELEYAKLALQKCHAKADKYKKLYIDEKRQTDELLKKLFEKDEDCNLLRDLWVKVSGLWLSCANLMTSIIIQKASIGDYFK